MEILYSDVPNRKCSGRPFSNHVYHSHSYRHYTVKGVSTTVYVGSGAGYTFFLSFSLNAAILFFFVYELMYVPMTKPTILKNGTHVCSGRNFCANARAMGEVTQLTFMTGKKPDLMVALI